jgi:predicted nucleic acid-binding protein
VSKIFIDTNILVYLLDKRNLKKHNDSRKIIRNITSQNELVISTQVLQEFYVATVTKLKIDSLLVKSIMHTFNNMEIINIGTELINEAIDTSIQYKLSFWDSLIVVAAESANCTSLYSEDLNEGQIIRNVKIINPFIIKK